jgi:hypothetical protein
MRIFKNFPQDDICLICGKNTAGACSLVGMDGTQEGNIEQARPVHLNCIELRLSAQTTILYQRVQK